MIGEEKGRLKVTKLAIVYNPPTLIVEYLKQLRQCKSTSKTNMSSSYNGSFDNSDDQNGEEETMQLKGKKLYAAKYYHRKIKFKTKFLLKHTDEQEEIATTTAAETIAIDLRKSLPFLLGENQVSLEPLVQLMKKLIVRQQQTHHCHEENENRQEQYQESKSKNSENNQPPNDSYTDNSDDDESDEIASIQENKYNGSKEDSDNNNVCPPQILDEEPPTLPPTTLPLPLLPSLSPMSPISQTSSSLPDQKLEPEQKPPEFSTDEIKSIFVEDESKPSSDLSTDEIKSSAVEEDLNKVSEERLKQAKEEMNELYNAKRILPGEDGYEYDKRVDFQALSESSWDG